MYILLIIAAILGAVGIIGFLISMMLGGSLEDAANRGRKFIPLLCLGILTPIIGLVTGKLWEHL